MAEQAIVPTHSQRAWMGLGYGMFIHFGPNTFAGTSWGDGRFPAAGFAPTHLDPAQWADMAAEAGMKYAVLTTKHHDGFCLWPSQLTEYSVKNSPGRVDVVGQFADAFRKAGLKVGLYYSLWDQNFADYENDAAYAAYMRGQISELLTSYGDIVELWFDGGWDKDHPTRQWAFDPAWEQDPHSGLMHGERWEWQQLYEQIHRLQSDCLVIKNSSSDCPGDVRYHPVDVRTSEHFHFIWEEQEHEAHLNPVFATKAGEKVYLPLEFCTTITPGWFWNAGQGYSHPSAATIYDWYTTARAAQANFLLNIGPDISGRLPEYHRSFLQQAARLINQLP
jgi:alpha-L-fucosidase